MQMFGQRSIALAVCCTVGLAIFAASLTHAVAADQPPTIQPAVEAEPAEAFVMPVAEDVPVDEAVVVSLEVPVDDTFPQTFEHGHHADRDAGPPWPRQLRHVRGHVRWLFLRRLQ